MLSSDIFVPISLRCTPPPLKPHLIQILFNQMGWMSKLRLKSFSCLIHLQDARTIMLCLINKVLKSHSPTFAHKLIPMCVHVLVCQDSWALTRVTHSTIVPPQLVVSWLSASTASPCLSSCCSATCVLVNAVEKNDMSLRSSSQNKSWPFDVQFSSESRVPAFSRGYLAHKLNLTTSSWRRATWERLKRTQNHHCPMLIK